MDVLTIVQERMMRSLMAIGISTSKAKAFALHADPDALSLMHAGFCRIDESPDGDTEEAARLFHTLYNTIERPVSGTLGGQVAME